jgi:hypothetical protein
VLPMSSMFDDDDDFGRENFDEGEVFTNTIVHIGQSLISDLFRHWAEHWPAMSDREFLPVLDVVRGGVGEFLGPDQIEELWGLVCYQYTEKCRAKEPKAKTQSCEAVVQGCLPEWHRIANEAKPVKQVKKLRGKKRK